MRACVYCVRVRIVHARVCVSACMCVRARMHVRVRVSMWWCTHVCVCACAAVRAHVCVHMRVCYIYFWFVARASLLIAPQRMLALLARLLLLRPIASSACRCSSFNGRRQKVTHTCIHLASAAHCTQPLRGTACNQPTNHAALALSSPPHVSVGRQELDSAVHERDALPQVGGGGGGRLCSDCV